jgi:hypothetical protein
MTQDNELFDMLRLVMAEESDKVEKFRKVVEDMCSNREFWCVRNKYGEVSKYSNLSEALKHVGPDDKYYYEGSPIVGKLEQPKQGMLFDV